MVTIKFMTLSGKFSTLREEVFPDMQAAKRAIEKHATDGGYRNVKEVMDESGDSLRFTATTPGGRGGRNIAYWDVE